ncbi:hypothetical protein ACS0TY_019290 [Phlomoides rotata]
MNFDNIIPISWKLTSCVGERKNISPFCFHIMHLMLCLSFLVHFFSDCLNIVQLDLEKGMMDCLYAKCTPCITDCVMAELEKLGQKYRVALRIAKDPRFERLPCSHKGTYADDCLVDRVTQFKCYIVATCDRDLKRRIRKVPGVPIMYITKHRYSIERLPEATIGGAPRM